MKLLVHGAALAAVLAFAAAAQAGPQNDGRYGRPERPAHSSAEGPGGSGYPQQGASAGSHTPRGPGSNVPYTVLHRHRAGHSYAGKGPGNGTPYAVRRRLARWHRARLSARDRMADQLNRAELARLRAGAPLAQPPSARGAGMPPTFLHCTPSTYTPECEYN